MDIAPIDTSSEEFWHVYVDGGLRAREPKILYKTKETLQSAWQTRFPDAQIAVK